MRAIDEIRETARIAKSFLSDNRPPYAILIALEDIPLLCDALEFLILELEVDGGYVDEVERILEGKE